MKNQEEKKVRLSEKPLARNQADTTDAEKTRNQVMNNENKLQAGIQFQHEDKFSENHPLNQHRKNMLDHMETPNHGDA